MEVKNTLVSATMNNSSHSPIRLHSMPIDSPWKNRVCQYEENADLGPYLKDIIPTEDGKFKYIYDNADHTVQVEIEMDVFHQLIEVIPIPSSDGAYPEPGKSPDECTHYPILAMKWKADHPLADVLTSHIGQFESHIIPRFRKGDSKPEQMEKNLKKMRQGKSFYKRADHKFDAYTSGVCSHHKDSRREYALEDCICGVTFEAGLVADNIACAMGTHPQNTVTLYCKIIGDCTHLSDIDTRRLSGQERQDLIAKAGFSAHGTYTDPSPKMLYQMDYLRQLFEIAQPSPCMD